MRRRGRKVVAADQQRSAHSDVALVFVQILNSIVVSLYRRVGMNRKFEIGWQRERSYVELLATQVC